MNVRRAAAHAAGILLGVFLLLGLPFLASESGQAWLSGESADAVSSASVILEAPDGSYYVLINRAFHTDEAALRDWEDYFTGDNPYIVSFENLSCSVAASDAGAVELADSFRSRLPENQMAVEKADPALLLSRAEHGCYDILIMSEEFAAANHFDAAQYSNAVTLEITGGAA